MRKELVTIVIALAVAMMLTAAKVTDYMWVTNIERDEEGNAIYFDSCDTMYGRVHSNDTLHFRNSLSFGPVYSAQDTIIAEGENHFEYEPELGVDSVFGYDGLYNELKNKAHPYVTTGYWRPSMTWIHMRGDAGIYIFQYPLGSVRQESLYTHLPPPDNEIIWVDGPVEVEGTLTGNLIIGSADNIYLIDDVRYTASNRFTGDFNEDDPSVGMLALVSEKDIIIDDNFRNGKQNGMNVGGQDWNRHSIVITAAMVCPNGSFTFEHQNYDWEMYQGPTPDYRGTVLLKGCVIQNRRGRLHTDNHEFTGYGLALRWDFRFGDSPPIPFEPERVNWIRGNIEELTLDTYHHYYVGGTTVRRLRIPVGANVNFVSGSNLTVLERLDIVGNEDSSIVLHSATNDVDDAHLRFEGTGRSRVMLSHLKVEEGISVDIDADTAMIDNVEFGSEVTLAGGLNVTASLFHDRLTFDETEGATLSRSVMLGGLVIDRNCTDLSIRNNTIVGSRNDGVRIEGGENIVLTNNIIASNRQGIYLQSLEFPTLNYNLVWNNGARDYVGLDVGQYDLSADPLFVNPRRDDFRLTANSPCIDAGDPASPRDPDGTVADIGAFWLDRGLGNDDDDNPPYPPFNRRGGLTARPNPFNATTVIRFEASPINREATVKIFDLAGREVFSQGKMTPPTPPAIAGGDKARASAIAGGEMTLTWDASAFPAGIYVVRVGNGKEAKTLKIVKVN